MLKVLLLFVLLYFPLSGLPQKPHARAEKDNIASIFLGSTTTEGKIVYTDGLELHRVIAFPFGATIVYENTPKNIERRSESEVFGLLTWNIPYDFMFGVGPGWQFKKDEPSVFLTRLKLGYIYLLPGRIEVMPNVNWDINPDTPNAWVIGLSLGKQF